MCQDKLLDKRLDFSQPADTHELLLLRQSGLGIPCMVGRGKQGAYVLLQGMGPAVALQHSEWLGWQQADLAVCAGIRRRHVS